MKLYYPVVILIWIAVAFGCSGIGTNPTQPVNSPADAAKSTSVDTGRQLWGMWDIVIDLETLSATVVPDRDVETHYNVLPFLAPPKCSDCLKLHINSFDPVSRILDLDATLRNKFAVGGYDVRGIVFTDDLGHMLNNEDAWTSLYYIPDGDTISPFKAYAKDDPQRRFPGKAELTENFRIWVPDPPENHLIKYAVDASSPSNCEEPYAFENFTQATIYCTLGSHGLVTVDVKDWQENVMVVRFEAPEITGEPFTPLSPGSGDTWFVDLFNSTGISAGDYPVKIAAVSAGPGATTAYYVPVLTISTP